MTSSDEEERKIDERLDRAWISGAKFGWNCGDAQNAAKLNAAIRVRLDDILESKRESRDNPI